MRNGSHRFWPCIAAAVAVVVSLVAVSVASAAILSMHQAHRAARQSAKEESDSSTPTGGYGVVRCDRISAQKVRCKDFAEFHDRQGSFKHTHIWWVAVTLDERGHSLWRVVKGTERTVLGYRY